MIYECGVCDYITKRLTDYERHKQTQKHITNQKNKNMKICEFCKKQFSTKANLNRHQKNNCEKPDLKVEHVQNIIVEQIDEKNKKIAYLQDEVNELKAQTKILLNLATDHSKSMRGMTRIIRNFKNSPPMKQLEGPAAIKLLTYDNKKSENDVVNTLVIKHRNKILKEYFGDIIINAYKKDDPELQSVWGIDTSRLIFTIKQEDWIRDKKGVTLTQLIIAPLLTKADEMINNYITKKANLDVPNGINELSNNYLICHEIKSEISKKTLHKKILQYITPSLEFNSNVIKKKTKN
jgi:hypothetical protein